MFNRYISAEVCKILLKRKIIYTQNLWNVKTKNVKNFVTVITRPKEISYPCSPKEEKKNILLTFKKAWIEIESLKSMKQKTMTHHPGLDKFNICVHWFSCT